MEMELTPEQVAAAKIAFQRLGSDTPLSEVVDFYFHSGPGGRKVTKLSAAIDQYAGKHAKAESAPGYVKAQLVSLNLLKTTLGDRELTHFSPERLDSWFNSMTKTRSWGHLNRLNYLRALPIDFSTGTSVLLIRCYEDDLEPQLLSFGLDGGVVVNKFTRQKMPKIDIKAENHHSVHMRTTLDLPDAIMRRVKIRAASEGRKLKDMISELLERGMAAPPTETPVGDEPGCIIDPVSGMARARTLKATTQRKVSIADSLAVIEEANSAEDILRAGLHR